MEIEAVCLSCGRLGLCLASVSAKLDSVYLSSKNAGEATSRLKITANRFEVVKDGHYVNARPKAEVLARLLQTHLAYELQQVQRPSASPALLVVVPSYPTTGSAEQASGIAVNTAKAEAMDAALRQLGIPGSCIVRQSTRCISGVVKTLYGQDPRALSAGKWQHRQQLERDAVELFLQEGRLGSATAEVLQQFRLQDGRKNADARHDLAIVFWLAAAALVQQAEQLRMQHKGQQLQVRQKQQAAEKERRAAEKQRRTAEKQQRASEQEHTGHKRRRAGNRVRSDGAVRSVHLLQVAAVAAGASAAPVPFAATYCKAEETIDLTGGLAAASHLTAAVKQEAAVAALDLTQPDSPAAAGWVAAAAAAATQPPGAPRKRRRTFKMEADVACIVLDD